MFMAPRKLKENGLNTFCFFVQFKKSGKEPKAAAELVMGNTAYKTKVINGDIMQTQDFCS